MISKLQTQFQSLLAPFVQSEDQINQHWEAIAQHYNQASRHYHNLNHLQNMFDEFDSWNGKIEDLDILQFSIFYHDIIYKATSKKNELNSAQFAEGALTSFGLSANRVKRCFDQIMLTKTHQAEETDPIDEKLLIDFDLEILSRDWEQYQLYCQQIRKEYSGYPTLIYRRGRKKAMENFMEKEFIYQTEWYRENKEPQARWNIRREIKEQL